MKTNKVKYPIFFVLFLNTVMFTGCASFSNTRVWHDSKKLTKHNLSELTGTYSFSPDYGYDKKGNREVIIRKNKQDYFYQYLTNKPIDVDTAAKYLISLTYLKGDSIAILIKKEKLIIDSLKLRWRLQSRGLLKIGKTDIKVHGIPYLLGGSQSKKTRIGLSKDGGLILNHAVDSGGALLLIIGSGYSYDFAYHFKRINPKS